MARSRANLPFKVVNHRGRPGFDPGLQRHHLLPRQALRHAGLAAMPQALGRERIGFDDFRRNGLLLPARDEAAIRLRLPLHCGPHRAYNELVIERVGQIEATWASLRLSSASTAGIVALQRLALLQHALRRRLLDPGTGAFRLNRRDPSGRPQDFSELDAMAATLWPDTEV